MPWSPLTVMAAAPSWPMRILRTMSGSSPATPPEYIFTSTLPPERDSHSAETFLRMVSHGEPTGARLPILIVSADAEAHTQRRTATAMAGHFLMNRLPLKGIDRPRDQGATGRVSG